MPIIQKKAIKLIKKICSPYKNLILNKTKLIDLTCKNIYPGASSFADLGGVWGVDGAYTFYALDKHKFKSAYLVDTDFTEAVIKRAGNYKNLKLIEGNFGEDKIIEKVGEVDVVILFDVLLHQVKQDWDEVIKKYAKMTNIFVVYNQQYIKSGKTVRLIDLGKDEYFKNVPHGKDGPRYTALFDKMYEINPKYNRIWRDVTDVWQWGITDGDLCAKMKDNGFELKYFKNYGRFDSLENIENHGFIFQKSR